MLKTDSPTFSKLLNFPWLLLILALIIGGLFRTAALETVPRGLQADEASFLINATAILETGRDEDNRLFPIYLHSLIDSKPALYAYLQIPFIALLGATTEASRLPGALLGTASIFLLYLLAHRVFKKQWLALLAAFFLAISPWHIMNSRATQEVILSFFFLLGNLILLYDLYLAKSLSKTKLVLFFMTALGAMYSYHALKIVLLGLYGGIFGFHAIVLLAQRLGIKLEMHLATQQLMRSALLGSLVILGFTLTASSALTRFSAIGLLSDDLPKAQIFEITTLTTGQTPLALVRIFYNKPVFYFNRFIEQYAAHFDPSFLFVTGGATRRFSVPYHGIFYLIDSVLITLGLYQLFSAKKYRLIILPLGLLALLSPIPAALTTEEIPSSIRTFTLLLPLLVLMTLGIEKLLSISQRNLRLIALVPIVLIYFWSIGYFAQQLFVAMPVLNTEFRSRHYEQIADRISQEPEKFASITFTNDLREMYIYLWKAGLIELQDIQAQPLARYQDSYSIGSYTFSQANCVPKGGFTTALVVSPHACEESKQNLLPTIEQVHFENKTPALSIFTTLTQ